MTIRLEGLTPLQVEICDRIWGMDTQEEVLEWFNALPRSLQVTAHAMLNLIVAEMIDQQVAAESDLSDVRELLEQYR